MAFTGEVVFVGGGILIALLVATYLIGRRSPIWAGIFFLTALLIMAGLNYL